VDESKQDPAPALADTMIALWPLYYGYLNLRIYLSGHNDSGYKKFEAMI
jgi:hypothetical protein